MYPQQVVARRQYVNAGGAVMQQVRGYLEQEEAMAMDRAMAGARGRGGSQAWMVLGGGGGGAGGMQLQMNGVEGSGLAGGAPLAARKAVSPQKPKGKGRGRSHHSHEGDALPSTWVEGGGGGSESDLTDPFTTRAHPSHSTSESDHSDTHPHPLTNGLMTPPAPGWTPVGGVLTKTSPLAPAPTVVSPPLPPPSLALDLINAASHTAPPSILPLSAVASTGPPFFEVDSAAPPVAPTAPVYPGPPKGERKQKVRKDRA